MASSFSAAPLHEVNGITYVKPLKRLERLMQSCVEEGKRLNVIRWDSEEPADASKTPRGAILFCHGYGHYAGLVYDFLATQLWYKCGIKAFAIEHFGHGKSEGLSAYVPCFDHLVDDVLAYSAFIRDKELPPMTPLFAYGESLGGGIAIHCALKAPSAFSGLVLAAPMTGVAEGVEPNAVVVAIGKIAAKLAPTLAAAPVKDILMYCFRDPKMYELARADPHRYAGKMRLGTAFQLKQAMEDLSSHGAELSTPFICFHGSGDKITSHHASEHLFDRCASKDKTLIIPEDAYHVLWFEELAIRRKMMEELCDWLDARCLKNTGDGGGGGGGGDGGAAGELKGSLLPSSGGGFAFKRVGCRKEGVASEALDGPDMHIYTLASHPAIYGEKALPKGGVVERPSEATVKAVLAAMPPRLVVGTAAAVGAGAPFPPVESEATGEVSPVHGVMDAVVKKVQSTSTMRTAAEAAAGE